MSDFDKTLHAQLRHLIDDLTVAVDDDGHTRYAPKNTLMFSNFIGALIELMPTLAARAQPAQAVPAVPVLTRDEVADLAMQSGAYDEQLLAFARAIEQAVRAKMGVAVPMTDAQINDAYGEAGVQHDHIPHDDVVRIARAVERHHGIVGKEGA